MAGVVFNTTPEPVMNGSFMFGDYDNNISGEQIVLAPTTVRLPAGTQLAKRADGQFVPIAPGASDGTQIWAATLFAARPVSTVTQKATGVVRRVGMVGTMLTYINAVTAAQKAAIEATMAQAMVIVRY